MNKREAKLQTKFNTWLKYQVGRPVFKNGARFELKVARNGISIPFSEVKEHQIQNLSAPYTIYKIPDDTLSSKPFDCFLHTGGGYIVVSFDLKEIFIINIETFLLMQSKAKKKSFTVDDARKYCLISDILKS